MLCGQAKCEAVAVGRFTWPGRAEAGICAEHLPKLRGVAEAMGLPLQVIPIVAVTDDARTVGNGFAHGLTPAVKVSL